MNQQILNDFNSQINSAGNSFFQQSQSNFNINKSSHLAPSLDPNGQENCRIFLNTTFNAGMNVFNSDKFLEETKELIITEMFKYFKIFDFYSYVGKQVLSTANPVINSFTEAVNNKDTHVAVREELKECILKIEELKKEAVSFAVVDDFGKTIYAMCKLSSYCGSLIEKYNLKNF